jgi:hypothetical protein
MAGGDDMFAILIILAAVVGGFLVSPWVAYAFDRLGHLYYRYTNWCRRIIWMWF